MTAFICQRVANQGNYEGLERVLMLFVNLKDVRWGSLFPRDPKSFTLFGRDPEKTEADAAQATIAKGSTAVKSKPGELPPLENVCICPPPTLFHLTSAFS